MSGDDADQIQRAKALLAKHGFRLEIIGCGCCGSPEVHLEHEGETIIGEIDPQGCPSGREHVQFSMFPETDDALRWRVKDESRRVDKPINQKTLALASGYDLDALAEEVGLRRRID